MTKEQWREKYISALMEPNRNLYPVRIDEARKAIVKRAQEIPETSNERRKLDYAIKMLRLLREAS